VHSDTQFLTGEIALGPNLYGTYVTNILRPGSYTTYFKRLPGTLPHRFSAEASQTLLDRVTTSFLHAAEMPPQKTFNQILVPQPTDVGSSTRSSQLAIPGGNKKSSTLSGGSRRRTSVSRALCKAAPRRRAKTAPSYSPWILDVLILEIWFDRSPRPS
jgi:hypothetical protein